MRVVIFGLTGFGNSALRAALNSGAEVCALVTRRELGCFPYYPERNLFEEARESKTSAYEDLDLASDATLSLLQSLQPDWLIVCSFHRKIPARYIQIPLRGAINVHPSMLPAYRGATPTSWCLLNGEAATGVTVHYLTEDIDTGPIIRQEELAVLPTDTNGSLRLKLAQLAQKLIRSLLDDLLHGAALNSRPQDESQMSYHPKWSKRDALIDFNQPVESIYRRVRACLPYPAPYSMIGGQPVLFQEARLVTDSRLRAIPGHIVDFTSGWLTVTGQDGLIQLRPQNAFNLSGADVLGT